MNLLRPQNYIVVESLSFSRGAEILYRSYGYKRSLSEYPFWCIGVSDDILLYFIGLNYLI